MALKKLTTFTKKVSDLADKPNATMTAEEVKAQFDAAPEELRQYYNELIDTLLSDVEGDSGAANIKATPITGLTGNDIQSLLESLKKLDDTNREYLLSQIQGAAIGQIPDGTITDAKLSNTEGQLKQRFKALKDKVDNMNLTASNVTTTSGTTVQTELNNLKSSVSNGKTEVKNAITGKGGTVLDGDTDGVNTFAELVAGVESISSLILKAGDKVLFSNNNIVSKTGSNLSKIKSIVVNTAGTIRVRFTIASPNSTYTRGQIFINGEAVGLSRSSPPGSTYSTIFTEDFTINAGDEVAIYGMNLDGSWVRNQMFEICGEVGFGFTDSYEY